MGELDDLLARATAGERRALARLLTSIESGDRRVRSLLPSLFAASHGAHVVGITGAPGTGKSTLVSALIAALRERGRRVGVIAVDPSSPYSRGSIMGDRIRMMEHSSDPDVFVRSMAARGELGGLAATTWIAAAAVDAAGFDPVLIETVGAGQSEVEIARLAETTIVVEVPGTGDEVQAIKAGLLEVADIVAVNKGDRPGAATAARQLRAMMSAAGGRFARKPPPILVTTATTGHGIPELVTAIEADRERARRGDAANQRAAEQVRRAVRDTVLRRLEQDPRWPAMVEQVGSRELDPVTAAALLADSRSDGSPNSDGFHHVQLACPPGLEGELRRFYGEILGMEEIAKPPALAERGGCWFRRGAVELHLGVEEDFRPARKAHPGIRAADLDALARRLEAAGVAVEWDDNFPAMRRFYVRDPSGNRLEFLADGSG